MSDLLGPDELTTRTVACAVLSPDMAVRIVHHTPSDAVPPEVRDAALDTWMREMAAITGKTEDQFTAGTVAGPDHDGPWERDPLRPWLARQRVLASDHVVLRVLWVDGLPVPERVVEPLAPGFLLINATAWTLGVTSGHSGQALAQGLLYHGLGHLLGVVNRGIPLHEPGAAAREDPQHHEPDGVMSGAWHQLASLPRDPPGRYSDGLVGDWRHAQTSQAVCG